jgi:superfamily II DNA or RNA helicase
LQFLSNIGTERLGDALASAIDDDAKLSIISSYFTVFAFGELKEELQKIDSLRFIFSEPTFIKKMQSSKEPMEFVLARRERERGIGGTGLELTLRNNLNQRALARECAEWIREKTEFRSAKHRGMVQPGGTYHVHNALSNDQGFMGASADFTMEGLGYDRKPHTVMGVSHYEGSSEADGLRNMFDSVWNSPEMVEDVTEAVAEQVQTLYRENPPEYIYFLTLYHLFRDFMSDSENDPIKPEFRLEDSVIWNKLYDFQKDAVVGAIHKLEKYKGCIIADSVGLGKTFEALAVMKYYQERNARILVLAPKRLRENWTLYAADNDERNVLADDRLNFTVLNHTDLSRYSGYSGDVNLETLRWGNYDLIVIDESHNFRNKPTDTTKRSRYDRLMEDIIKSGIRTKVLMLSATPVNNRLLDLRNQIEIITEGDDEYLAEEGIPSINNVTRRAQQRFQEWSKLDDEERTTQSFVAAVNADYFKLLDVLTIARSRKHIDKYYTAGDTKFPERQKPISKHPPIDSEGKLPSIADLNDMIASLTFAQYQQLAYVMPMRQQKYVDMYGDTWGRDFESQINRTQAVANLMRVNLLKRLESSIDAFRITLERIYEGNLKTKRMLDRAEALIAEHDMESFMFDDEEDYSEYMASSKIKVDPTDLDRIRLGQDIDYDIHILEQLLGYAREITPDRDEKLKVLKSIIEEKVANPFNAGNRKILIFSAFADTVSYLYDQLSQPLADELGLECAMVTGDVAKTHSLKLKRATFDTVLAHFSPVSKELAEKGLKEGEIDILFATDCISEGQNLQDCDCLVNYDIHWNPVRIIQRFGRIDRLGSTNETIQLINFWPDLELDEYIQLEGRVKGRMALLDASATGEENVLEGKSNTEMNDLKYRRQQLMTLQDEVLNLEDMSNGISITDFAFDDFRVELQRYAQDHPGLLEDSPSGLCAVARIPEELEDDVEPGILFCLRQNDESRDPKDTNPTFPFYVIYVTNDGSVTASHTQPKNALDIMRAACDGQTEPVLELCKRFNQKTKDGTDMSSVNALLQAAVADITGIQETKGIESLFSAGEVGSGAALGFDDYSIVSFVVLAA